MKNIQYIFALVLMQLCFVTFAMENAHHAAGGAAIDDYLKNRIFESVGIPVESNAAYEARKKTDPMHPYEYRKMFMSAMSTVMPTYSIPRTIGFYTFLRYHCIIARYTFKFAVPLTGAIFAIYSIAAGEIVPTAVSSLVGAAGFCINEFFDKTKNSVEDAQKGCIANFITQCTLNVNMSVNELIVRILTLYQQRRSQDGTVPPLIVAVGANEHVQEEH